ncbi:MAG: ABC transporter substrate-binding protein, partial [Chloroflexota bacterium]
MLLFLAAVLGACQNGGENGGEDTPEPTPTPTPTPVPLEGEATIYVAGPLSGPDAASGQAQAAGARLAADQLNRVGGLQGRRINIETINDFGDPEGAQSAAEQITEAARSGEDVAGVVTFGGSDPELDSVSGGYLGADGLDSLVVMPASDELVTGQVDDERFFQLSAPVVRQAREVAAVMRERNLKDVALVHSDSEYGRGLAEEFERSAEELGVGTAATFEIASGSVTYSDQVTQVREMNPSGLFFAAEDEEAAVFLSELFGFEFQGSVIGANKSLSYNLVDRLGCQAEGLSFASVLPSPESTMSAELLGQYEEQEGRAPDRHTVAGYSAVEFITRAYAEAGSLDAGAAAGTARESEIQTLMGNVAFDAQGNLVRPRIHFFQVQGRQLRHQFTRDVGEAPRMPEGQQGDGGTLLDLSTEGQDPIVFAGLDWDSARFANTVARLIIEAGYGYPTESTAGSSVPLFQSLRQGDVDVYL